MWMVAPLYRSVYPSGRPSRGPPRLAGSGASPSRIPQRRGRDRRLLRLLGPPEEPRWHHGSGVGLTQGRRAGSRPRGSAYGAVGPPPASAMRLQRRKEIQQGAQVVRGERSEAVNGGLCLAAVGEHGRADVAGLTIVEEPLAAAEPPERGGTPIAAARLGLHYPVFEQRPHVMKEQIGVQLDLAAARGQAAGMADAAPDPIEHRLAC